MTASIFYEISIEIITINWLDVAAIWLMRGGAWVGRRRDIRQRWARLYVFGRRISRHFVTTRRLLIRRRCCIIIGNLLLRQTFLFAKFCPSILEPDLEKLVKFYICAKIIILHHHHHHRKKVFSLCLHTQTDTHLRKKVTNQINFSHRRAFKVCSHTHFAPKNGNAVARFCEVH